VSVFYDRSGAAGGKEKITSFEAGCGGRHRIYDIIQNYGKGRNT
jgi:hypothetical protein